MGKHLDFYFTCMQTGMLPTTGLCHCASDGYIDAELFKMFEPTEEDLDRLYNEGIICTREGGYWGSGKKAFGNLDSPYERTHSFSALRQTIVLFMAVLNNEL